jgi:hypothetical protein
MVAEPGNHAARCVRGEDTSGCDRDGGRRNMSYILRRSSRAGHMAGVTGTFAVSRGLVEQGSHTLFQKFSLKG